MPLAFIFCRINYLTVVIQDRELYVELGGKCLKPESTLFAPHTVSSL